MLSKSRTSRGRTKTKDGIQIRNAHAQTRIETTCKDKKAHNALVDKAKQQIAKANLGKDRELASLELALSEIGLVELASSVMLSAVCELI